MTNGQYHGPPPPIRAQPVPRTEVWVPLAQEYPDWQFLFWRNHPRAVRAALFDAKSEDDRRPIFKRLILAHNGWNHEGPNGEAIEYPQPNADSFWEDIPTEVAMALYIRVREESVALPNSLIAKTLSSAPSSASAPSAEPAAVSASPGPTSDEP